MTVYELTAEGRALDDVLRSLAQWGSRTMGLAGGRRLLEHVAVHMRFRPRPRSTGAYEVRFVGGETFSLDVRDGRLIAIRGEASEPTLAIEAEPPQFHALIEGIDTVETALVDGVRILTGSEAELRALVAMFAPTEAQAAAAAA